MINLICKMKWKEKKGNFMPFDVSEQFFLAAQRKEKKAAAEGNERE